MYKQFIKRTITGSKILRYIVNQITGDFPKVLVYHRFAPPGAKIPHRVNADEFGWQLDQIQGNFQVITLAECLEHYRINGNWPGKSIVITVDDGYRDFYEWAYPQLNERGLKATFFVTTNFLDGNIWLWPDRLEYAIRSAHNDEVTVIISGNHETFSLVSKIDKTCCLRAFIDYCISCPNEEKERFISDLIEILRVELPDAPPPEFRPTNWNELREMQGGGIEIGSHTMNHPILSRIDQARLIEEVFTSKKILEGKTGSEIKSFCYPNSAPQDITNEVVKTVEMAGYAGAVFGVDLKTWHPYKVPRIGVSHDRTDFLWKLCGGESL